MIELKRFGPSSNLSGYWDPITSSIDWCEQNYVVTYYIAEFWNTLSSLLIAFWAIIGIVICMRRGLEKRFLFLYASTIVVGLGSAFFHGTLLYSGQMSDELPMMWFIMTFGYVIVKIRTVGTHKFLVGAGVFYALLCSIIHYRGAYVVAFQVHFAFLVLFCGYRLILLHREEKKTSYSYFPILAIFFFFSSFFFWITDNLFCSQLLASGYHPQGHAIWHVLNSFGINLGVQYTIALRLKHLGYEVATETHLWMPYIVPKRKLVKNDK